MGIHTNQKGQIKYNHHELDNIAPIQRVK